MNDEIEFGELRTLQPETVLPPDRDEHYAVASVGEPAAEDLRIFVDLDVWHELENHALSDTRVELGGVLLGEQALDPEGRPLVIVRDSLRARHYRATRGSFRFTHATWSELTRRRERMNARLAMVGWYHTHPGWGIFLSDLDEFICRHFFGRPMDVALVIDPCQDQRGWFHWGSEGRTQRCGGYYLFTSRLRGDELRALVAGEDPADGHAAEEGMMMHNRMRISGGDGRSGGAAGPGLAWAALALAGVQTLLLATVLVWLVRGPVTGPPGVASRVGAPGSGMDGLGGDPAGLAAENRLYRELAAGWLQGNGQPADLADELVRLKMERDSLAEANRSHMARIRELVTEAERSRASEKELARRVEGLEQQLAEERRTANSGPGSEPAGPPMGLPEPAENDPARSWWLWGTLLGLAGCGAAGLVMWLLGRRPVYENQALEGPNTAPFSLQRPAAEPMPPTPSGPEPAGNAPLKGQE